MNHKDFRSFRSMGFSPPAQVFCAAFAEVATGRDPGHKAEWTLAALAACPVITVLREDGARGVGGRYYTSNPGQRSDMTPLRPTLASCAAALLMTGAATAAASQQLAGASTAKPATRSAPGGREPQQPQYPLQALCREIFVDVDEGYGVSGQRPRTICDEPR